MRALFAFATAALAACGVDTIDAIGVWHVGIIPDPAMASPGCTMAYPDPETWVVTPDGTVSGPLIDGAAATAGIACEATRCRLSIREDIDYSDVHQTIARSYVVDDRDQITGAGSIQVTAPESVCSLRFGVTGYRDPL
jgi:hypothetical protein